MGEGCQSRGGLIGLARSVLTEMALNPRRSSPAAVLQTKRGMQADAVAMGGSKNIHAFDAEGMRQPAGWLQYSGSAYAQVRCPMARGPIALIRGFVPSTSMPVPTTSLMVRRRRSCSGSRWTAACRSLRRRRPLPCTRSKPTWCSALTMTWLMIGIATVSTSLMTRCKRRRCLLGPTRRSKWTTRTRARAPIAGSSFVDGHAGSQIGTVADCDAGERSRHSYVRRSVCPVHRRLLRSAESIAGERHL